MNDKANQDSIVSKIKTTLNDAYRLGKAVGSAADEKLHISAPGTSPNDLAGDSV